MIIEVWKTGPKSLSVFLRGCLPLGKELMSVLKIPNALVIGQGDLHLFCRLQSLDIISEILGINENTAAKIRSIPWTSHRVFKINAS